MNIYNDIFFISNDDICFYVEKIPQDLGYISLVRFKNTVTKMINGYLLEKFHVSEYFVCLYVKQKPVSKKISIILLKIIDAIKNFFKIKIFCEIWIIKEFDHYKCIGLYYGAPVFYKTFSSSYDVNINFSLLIDSIKQYSNLDIVRFFGCNYNEFNDIQCSVFEYSDNLLKSFVGDYVSFDNYCKTHVLQEIYYKNFFIFLFGLSFILNCFSLYFALQTQSFNKLNQKVVSEINLLSKITNNLPPKSHIEHINEILDG